MCVSGGATSCLPQGQSCNKQAYNKSTDFLDLTTASCTVDEHSFVEKES